MNIIWIAFAILIIIFCAVGIIVCFGVFADKLDDLLKGGLDDDEQDL